MGRYRNSGIGKGIGTSPQLSLENQEYENKVHELEEKLQNEEKSNDKTISKTLCNDDDIKKLENAGVKFNKDDVIFVANDSSGHLIWLEKGNEIVGLEHIISKHKQNFKDILKINENEIPSKIYEIISTWNLVSKSLKNIGGRDGYECIYENNGNYIVIVAHGTNGFIVSVYPRKEN